MPIQSRSVWATAMFALISQTISANPVFKAGAATSNITPPLGLSIAGAMHEFKGTHIHDELHARCLVLDDGTLRLVVLTVDSCLVPREIFDKAKALIQSELGIPPENVLMAATHTHSAPAATRAFQSSPDQSYLDFMVRRIVDGVHRAVHNLEPARIGWGTGQEPSLVFNRRWRMKEGGIPPDPFGRSTDQVRMNPPRADVLLDRPSGPTDPEVVVVSIQSVSGRPLAVLANYSLHYVGGVGPGDVSADYFGAFAEIIEDSLGAQRQDPPFVAILSNGTSGNINNIDFTRPGEEQPPYEQIRKVAGTLAQEVMKVLAGISYRDWVSLASRQTEISLGVRKPTPEEVTLAKAVVQEVPVGQQLMSFPQIYAGETLALAEYPEQVPLILQAFRIGELGIAAIPCEVFVETGLQIKAESPLKPTFTMELANGYNGYLPTPEQHRLGGYETWRAKSSYLEVEASTKITKEILSLLEALARQPK